MRPVTSSQQLTATLAAAVVSGFSALMDAMICSMTLPTLRKAFKFDDLISEDLWFTICLGLATIYSLSTLTSEGKGVQDTVLEYYATENKKHDLEVIDLESGLPLEEGAFPEAPQPPSDLIWWSSRVIAVVSALADSSETTMGLMTEGASNHKTVIISALSFLSSFCFYGLATIAAMNEFEQTGPRFVEQKRPARWLAKVIGYPIALFSASQDTLECGASCFQNFGITNRAAQWGIVSSSSLAGISGMCLDGKKGVEIIDDFFDHLSRNYLRNPAEVLLDQLAQEILAVGASAYAASYIAFADKDLTIMLTQNILVSLGIEFAALPAMLGWCVMLRDFVIQTKTLHMVGKMALNTSLGFFNASSETQAALHTPLLINNTNSPRFFNAARPPSPEMVHDSLLRYNPPQLN